MGDPAARRTAGDVRGLATTGEDRRTQLGLEVDGRSRRLVGGVVAVGFQDELAPVEVTEPGRCGGRAVAGPQYLGGAVVAKGVERVRPPLDPRRVVSERQGRQLPAVSPEALGEDVGLDDRRTVDRLGEDEGVGAHRAARLVGDGIDPLAVLGQEGQRGVADRDCPPPFVLGQLEARLVPTPPKGAAHVDQVGGRVDVAPAEPADLSAVACR